MENVSEWFNDSVEMIDLEEVKESQSRWGNSFHTITKKQAKELLKGKVIYIDDGEYCHFIKIEND